MTDEQIAANELAQEKRETELEEYRGSELGVILGKYFYQEETRLVLLNGTSVLKKGKKLVINSSV